MALRLTAPSSPKPSRPLHVELVEQAEACVRARDYKGYRELFSRAAEVEDAQDRYRARKYLLEVALGRAANAESTDLGPLFHAAALGAVEALEADPCEPLLLNYAGVIFYELGSLKSAEALFKAALRLDSDLPHVRRNIDEIARRRRAGADPTTGIPRNVVAALQGVNLRAVKVAARAKPAKGLKLSLCMIVKDEEEMLPRSLAAAKDAVDEIIVVDTGSSDRTVEIAKSFGATVLEREWTGDFSEARNASFDAASCDWIIYLDADEVLVEEDAPRLRELTGKVWREAFYLVETNYTGDLADGSAVTHNAMRVFRNRPEYRFEGRLHEQIAQNLPAGLPERIEASTVRVEHYGYLGAVRDAKEKSRRNIELLEQQMQESPPTAFLHYNLGSEYAAAEQNDEALVEFKRSWELLREDPHITTYGFAPSLMGRLVRALRVCGELDAAERQAEEGLRIFPRFTDLLLESAYARGKRGDAAGAAELLEQCIEWGDAPSKYSASVGCGTYLPKLALADVRRAQGDDAEAVRLLKSCLHDHPSFLGSVLPLAAAMLATGAEAADVAAEIEEGVESTTPSVRFMLGTALYEAGQPEAAEDQFRAVLEAQPHNDGARVALAESLLSQRRYDESAAAAAAVADESPCAVAAFRTQLFAALVTGDGEVAAATLARAQASGMRPHEVSVFSAWNVSLSGETVSHRLPLEAAPLVAVMLEALLRVQEVDAFAALLPVLDAVDMQWRDRHELLAQLYLRRGFVESAADEWIAVCEQQGPDAQALIGLAQVAHARELPEDALVFAQEAHALEPQNPLTARLLERLAVA